MALAPNSGYGLLNTGTTSAPKVAAPGPYTAAPTTATTTSAAPAQAPIQNPQSQQQWYTDLLKNDPILGQQLSGYNASGVSNQAALNAAQQRALIQYGSVPGGALPGVTGIDQTTRDLADQNTAGGLSTLAKIRAGYQQADQASVASEAARGILHSGAYGQHAAENLLNYNQAQDTGTQTLLDYLSGLYNGYLQQQQTLQQQAASSQGDALSRIISQITTGQITYPTTVPHVAGTDYPAFTQTVSGQTEFTPEQLATIAALPVNQPAGTTSYLGRRGPAIGAFK